MDFKVFTDTAGSYDNFTDKAVYAVLDGGALEVKPNDDGEVKRIVYGPAGWVKVEVTTERTNTPSIAKRIR